MFQGIEPAHGSRVKGSELQAYMAKQGIAYGTFFGRMDASFAERDLVTSDFKGKVKLLITTILVSHSLDIPACDEL